MASAKDDATGPVKVYLYDDVDRNKAFARPAVKGSSASRWANRNSTSARPSHSYSHTSAQPSPTIRLPFSMPPSHDVSEESTFTYPTTDASDSPVAPQPVMPVSDHAEAHGWDAWGSAVELPKTSNPLVPSSDDDHARQDSGFSSADHRSHSGSHAEVKVNAKASNTEPSASVASDPWAAWQASASASSGGAEAYEKRAKMQSPDSLLASSLTSMSTSRLAPAPSDKIAALSAPCAASCATTSISSANEVEQVSPPAADSDPWSAYQPIHNAAVTGEAAYERRKHLSSATGTPTDRQFSKSSSTASQVSKTTVSLSSMPKSQTVEQSSAATLASDLNATEADPWASYVPSTSETGSSAYERRKQLKNIVARLPSISSSQQVAPVSATTAALPSSPEARTASADPSSATKDNDAWGTYTPVETLGGEAAYARRAALSRTFASTPLSKTEPATRGEPAGKARAKVISADLPPPSPNTQLNRSPTPVEAETQKKARSQQEDQGGKAAEGKSVEETGAVTRSAASHHGSESQEEEDASVRPSVLIDFRQQAQLPPVDEQEVKINTIADDLSGLSFTSTLNSQEIVKPPTIAIADKEPAGLVVPASPASTASFHSVFDGQVPEIQSPVLFPVAYVSQRSSTSSASLSPTLSITDPTRSPISVAQAEFGKIIAAALLPFGFTRAKSEAVSKHLIRLSDKERLRCMLSEAELISKITLAIQLVELEEEEGEL